MKQRTRPRAAEEQMSKTGGFPPPVDTQYRMSKTGGFDFRFSGPMDTFDASRLSCKKRYHQELMPSINRTRMNPSRNQKVQPIERNVKSNMTDFRKSNVSLMDKTK
jgi:hypothetical protein